MKNNLERNTETIRSINPELAEKINAASNKCDWIDRIKSKSGTMNLLIRQGGTVYPAYDMKDPVREARAAVKNMRLYKQNVSVLVGMGLGYLVAAILEKAEKGHRIVVAEPQIEIIKTALEIHDFSEALAKKMLIIVTNIEQVVFVTQVLSNEFVIENWLMTCERYTHLRSEQYSEIMRVTSESLNQILCNTGTIAGTAGGIIADNDITCLPYVIRHRGVNELKNLYKDKPAILVSTGPSLAKNIHHLRDMRNRAIIIAVGQALRPLLAYEIRPDFICTVDFGEVNIGHFKGLMNSGIPLVTINRTYAPLLKQWQGPKFIAATPVPGFEERAAGILADKGYIEAGGSVAHLCFGLAQLLGCNPIAFVGQDLALGETSHIPLADAMGDIGVTENGQIVWKVRDQRCSLHGEVAHSMGLVHTVPGYYGKPVLTNFGLASFLTVFELMIKAFVNKDKLEEKEEAN